MSMGSGARVGSDARVEHPPSAKSKDRHGEANLERILVRVAGELDVLDGALKADEELGGRT